MRVLVALVGAAVILGVTVDLLATTLAVRTAAGPVTGRLSRLLWGRALHAPPQGRVRRAVSSVAGVGTVVTTVGAWIALTLVGWSLVFHGAESAVIDGGEPASTLDRVYFAGSSLFTLGLGEVIPEGTLWRLLAMVAAGNGLLLVTLSIAYFLPVMSSVAEKRQLAGYITALGASTEGIVARTWGRDRKAVLEQHLVTITPMLGLLAQRHLTYPALHSFHGLRRSQAAAPSIAALDDCLTVLHCCTPEDERPDPLALEPARAAVLELLETLASAFIEPAYEPPPPPSWDRLRESGVDLVDRTEFHRLFAVHGERRRLLAALVTRSGWTWEHVSGEGAYREAFAHDERGHATNAAN